MTLEIAVDTGDVLGEVPLWCDATQRLIWTDVRACKVHALNPVTRQVETWRMPDWAGAIALQSDGDLMAASRKSLVSFNLQSQQFTVRLVLEADMPDNRTNDARCDRQGRFWVGTLNNADRIATGSLYRINTSNGELVASKQLSDIIVPNALCWSPDGRTMYFADSWIGDIWAFDYNVDDGAISNRRVLVSADQLPGIPDGATVDSAGCLWHARYGAGQVVRVTPDGAVDTVIQSDTQQLTACTLGGSDFRDLYVTSARQRMTDEQLKAQPDAGALFVARVETAGLPEPRVQI